MRKLVLFLHQSLDGYCATKDGALDWIPYNEAFEKYAERIVKTVGSPVYGRVTYEMMKGYWSTLSNNPAVSTHEREHAQWLENVEKIVVSTTLATPDWKNTTVIRDNVQEQIKKLKDQDGKSLVIFGSPTLARSLMKAGLIDEFQFTVSPVILGEGITFMRSIEDPVNLELLDSESIEGGIVVLHYRVLK
jgi:dihydrofolate reductase